MVGEFKKAFGLTACQDEDTLPYLRVYPTDAADLLQALREHSYAVEPAVPKRVDAVQSIMTHHMPLRPTSKLLAGSLPVATPQRSSAPRGLSSSNAVSEDDPLTLGHFLMGCRMLGLAGQENGHARRESTPLRLTMPSSKCGPDEQLLALPAPTETRQVASAGQANTAATLMSARAAAAETGGATLQPRVRVPAEATASEDKPASEPPLSELEQQAFEKLQKKAMDNKTSGAAPRGRAGRGRGCGRGRGKSQATAGKDVRAANCSGKTASGKPRKRPAAASSFPRAWAVQKPTAKQRAGSKESYVSTQYHQAKQHALRQLGCDEAAAKEHARRAYNEAKAFW